MRKIAIAVFALICFAEASNVFAQNAYSTVSSFAGRTHRGRFVIRDRHQGIYARGRWGGGIQPWVASGLTTTAVAFLNNNPILTTAIVPATVTQTQTSANGNSNSTDTATTGEQTVLEAGKRHQETNDDFLTQHAARKTALDSIQSEIDQMIKSRQLNGRLSNVLRTMESNAKPAVPSPASDAPEEATNLLK